MATVSTVYLATPDFLSLTEKVIMNEIPLKLTVTNLTKAEKEELLSVIELTSVRIQSESERILGVDDVLEIIIIAMVSKLAEKTIESATSELAKVIKKWRDERQQAGKQILGKLEGPERPPLNLDTATDKEIEQWLSHK